MMINLFPVEKNRWQLDGFHIVLVARITGPFSHTQCNTGLILSQDSKFTLTLGGKTGLLVYLSRLLA